MKTSDGREIWIYYSSLIPGYAEKYGLRGMRERNRKLLPALSRARNEQKRETLRKSLLENNLPLAMYTADMWRKKHHMTREQRDDLFQDSVICLSGYIHSLEGDDFKPGFFQARCFWRMWGSLNSQFESIQLRTVPATRFVEEEFIPEQDESYVINTTLLFDIARVLTERENDIIRRLYGIGCDLEDPGTIGLDYILSRDRVRKIADKAIKKLQKHINYSLNNHEVSIDDFLAMPYELKTPAPYIPFGRKKNNPIHTDICRIPPPFRN